MNATIELTSLILDILITGEPWSMQELCATTRRSRAQVYPIIRELVARGLVCTSGRTRGTRYLLVVEEQTGVAAPIAGAVIAAATCQRGARTRRPRAAKPAIEVIDLTVQLAATLALATPAAPLHTVRSEPAPLAQLLPTHDALMAAVLEHDPFQSLLPGRTWQEEVLARAAEWQAETAAMLGGVS